MSIPFTCPHCGKFSEVDDQYAGHAGPCASCGQTITVPGSPAAPYAARSSRPKKSSAPLVLIILGVIAVASLPVILILVALLLPAVQAAREAARRMQCMNNVKVIMLAVLNHESAYNVFPGVNAPPGSLGVEPYSWRVRLLPFMEEKALYDRYDVKEPWNSPKNQALVAEMPTVYTCPSDRDRTPGKTPYHTVSGLETIFPAGGASRNDVRDGTMYTIAVVESHQGKAIWTDTKDLEFASMQFQPNAGPEDIGSSHGGGVTTVGMADGSVRAIRADIDPQVLRAMLTRRGGEPVTLGK